MVPIALPLLALGLSMDATAVAMTCGFTARTLRARDVLLTGTLFGGFQAAMPWLGATIGARFEGAIEAWDHWVAFVLLGGIGAKMLLDAWRPSSKEEAAAQPQPFAPGRLLMLAVATSIDALVAGVTLPLLEVPLRTSLAFIGLTTFGLSCGGVVLGRRFGNRWGHSLETVGGAVLIALGVKILLAHWA
jgi:putative Mn2+ efflux pump MntP